MGVLHVYMCLILAGLCSSIVVEDSIASSAEKSASFQKADGSKYQDEYYAEKGVKGDKGYKHENHHEKGLKGQYGNEHHVQSYEEDGGKKKKDFDEGNHESSHHLEGGSHHGGKHHDKKGHKRGQKMAGFHNKYFKDEFHKQHRFYDKFHKEGSHSKFGNYRAKFANGEREEKKGGSHKSGRQQGHFGKKGGSSKGHHDEGQKGHKKSRGNESHYSKGANYGRQGGHKGGKQYGYSRKY